MGTTLTGSRERTGHALYKEVLRHLGVTPGQKVEIDLLSNRRLEVRAAKSGASIDSFIGCRYRP